MLMQASQKEDRSSKGKKSLKTSFNDEIKFAKFFIDSANINELLTGLKKKMRGYFDAEAFTIYFADNKKQHLVSKVKAGRLRKEIQLPIDKTSIAGFVASTGLVVNIVDAHDKSALKAIDPQLRFNSSLDDRTKFTTRQVLAAPIFCQEKIFGVMQLFNKKSSNKFTHDDIENLKVITEEFGRFITNSKLNNLQSRKTKDKQLKSEVKVSAPFGVLIKNGIISEDKFSNALYRANKKNKDLEQILIDDFDLSKAQLGRALAEYYGVVFENLTDTIYNPIDLIEGKSIDFFLRGLWVPLYVNGNELILAINDPHDKSKIQDVQHLYRTSNVGIRFALKEDIKQFLNSFKGHIKTNGSSKSVNDIINDLNGTKIESLDHDIEDFEEHAGINENSVVQLVRKIIENANLQMASDIHIEPYSHKKNSKVRYRIDGRCQQSLTIPTSHIGSVIARIKVMAKMDISEKRKPQDGKIRFKTTNNQIIELRVAAIPTNQKNEDIVIRLLTSAEPLPLNRIMRNETFERFKNIIQKPYGIILVVGPTGSGKTTTLHSALRYINKPERKIWTAEDPVEITQDGLRQLQVNSKAGPSFAQAMRAFLRGDPDVIMVGEMRDHETVKMGIEASLTGHLVFSTLHTNSAPETITRLIDMGMNPFNFADALLGVLAQRLTRVLCPKCKEGYHPNKYEYDNVKELYGGYFDERLNVPYTDDLIFYQGKGCKKCNNIGYKGRMGLYELLLGDRPIKRQILERCLVDDLREVAIKNGMTTLLQDGIHNTFLGKTDMKQVLSVCSR